MVKRRCVQRGRVACTSSAGDKPQPYISLGRLSAVHPKSVFVPIVHAGCQRHTKV